MIDRLTSKRAVLLLVLGAASVVLVSGSQVWVSGSVDDVVLGVGALHGTGSQIAPGALAAALVGLAAAVVAATSGAVVRLLAACSAVLAGVLGAAVVISVLVDPGAALGTLAAAGTGRSGDVQAHGTAGGWAWVALAATVVMGTGGLGALAGRRRWQGLSSRYDVSEPVAGGAAAQPAQSPGSANSANSAGSARSSQSARSAESAWDQLSRGEDPTAGQ